MTPEEEKNLVSSQLQSLSAQILNIKEGFKDQSKRAIDAKTFFVTSIVGGVSTLAIILAGNQWMIRQEIRPLKVEIEYLKEKINSYEKLRDSVSQNKNSIAKLQFQFEQILKK